MLESLPIHKLLLADGSPVRPPSPTELVFVQATVLDRVALKPVHPVSVRGAALKVADDAFVAVVMIELALDMFDDTSDTPEVVHPASIRSAAPDVDDRALVAVAVVGGASGREIVHPASAVGNPMLIDGGLTPVGGAPMPIDISPAVVAATSTGRALVEPTGVVLNEARAVLIEAGRLGRAVSAMPAFVVVVVAALTVFVVSIGTPG
ncbi:hypothetical protein BN946_scf184767.g8 [Trametes cinnabarina]|uniref:Uncharacterized protein n=1 Tax=Pycnoporus cinnabarinus TaxID=5643 RepID=A0A060SSF7_PYCCI|nr:hypothetical protein BN946_scf184767.g8 [Trametes cinnabarina]